MTEWNKKIVLKFLEAYEGEPVIWNRKHPSHKDKNAVMNAWNRLSRIMDKPVFNLKKKRESLMAMFRTLSRKKRESLRQGYGVSDFKTTWFAFETMERILAKANDECEFLNETETSEVSLNVSEKTESKRLSVDPSSEEHDYSLRESKLPTSTPLASQAHYETPKRHYAHADLREANNLMKQAFAPLNNMLNKRQSPKEEDECDLFGRLIAKKLKKFGEQEREETMYEIETLILKKKHPQALNTVYSPSSSNIYVEGKVETELYCPPSPFENQ